MAINLEGSFATVTHTAPARARLRGAVATVVHGGPLLPRAQLRGAVATVVHGAPSRARLRAGFASVVHGDPAPDPPPVVVTASRVITLRPDQLRARVAATLEGLEIQTGTRGTLHEAPCDYYQIPDAVPAQRQHLAFGVSVTRTGGNPPHPGQRQGRGRPLRVESDVSVRLLHKQRETDATADLDAAMAAESEAIVAVLGISKADGLQVSYMGTSERRPVPASQDVPAAVLVTIEFMATHFIPTT